MCARNELPLLINSNWMYVGNILESKWDVQVLIIIGFIVYYSLHKVFRRIYEASTRGY